MGLQNTLVSIEVDVEKGLKYKATQRLRSLITTYPNDLSLRERLAELYYQSGFLDMAGLYWFLTEPTDERIQLAVSVYESSVSHSSQKILADIKYRGHRNQLSDYGLQKLTQLEATVSKGAGIKSNKQKNQRLNQIGETIFEKGCLVFLALLLVLCLLGLVNGAITVTNWLID